MTERFSPQPNNSQTPPPDRSHSIDPRHTFARGGYDSPNSGPEHNPVLEVGVSLPAAELHEEPVVRETQTG